MPRSTPDVAASTQTERSRTTLDELAKARPRRGSGAPARCASHKSAILALLLERGPRGVLSSELYNSPEKFGRSPRNRISELRSDGHLIEGDPRGSSDWFYRLIRDSAGEKPQADSPDWYESENGPRPASHPWKKPISEKRLAEPDCFVLTPPEPKP
jgi:hypothetical protein